MRFRRTAWIAMLVVVRTTHVAGQASTAPAQPDPRSALQGEARVDATRVPSAVIVHGGVGVSRPFGTYARLGAVVAAGVRHGDGASSLALRGDLVARLTPDPFRQSRFTPFVAAGASARRDAPGAVDVYVLLLVGVEGPEWWSTLPALEIGYGGGLRAGVVIRQARRNRR